MFTRFVSTTIAAGAIFSLASVPVHAQADIGAKVQICAACHGANGVPTDPKTMPSIWGQTEYYLYKQLLDYRSGRREHPIMTNIAKTLATQDLRPIAKFFAAKTWPAHQGPAPGAEPAKMDNCKICHQPKFEGGQPAPRLAGLSYEYLIGAMDAFANDTRTNNGDMPTIMKALNESERQAIARYVSGL